MKNLQPQINFTFLLATACLTVAGTVLAFDPALDGGYSKQNAAAGHDTLLNGTAGADNTAMRFDVLDSNTTGPDNPLASWIWRVRGELNVQRSSHTATLLQDGMVLVAAGNAGETNSGPLRVAELYNPASGTWALTGELSTPRFSHTATLLQSGMVLVAGGTTHNYTLTNTAEVYDPASGTWTATARLNVKRSSHTATLLENGMVLVAGGQGITGVLTSTELGRSHH